MEIFIYQSILLQKMNEKTKKLLFEYIGNSRISTKELGKKIGSSQQSVSYLLNSNKEKKLILEDALIIDAVKLGYINIFVGFNYIKTESKVRKETILKLKEIDEIIGIEESKEGFDLLVEFSVKNLAAFDKIHINLVHKFDKLLKTAFIFPIVTKYKYPKKYLRPSRVAKSNILFSDREVRVLSKNEKALLLELIKNPTVTITELSTKLKLNVKSIINLKKGLEKKYVIKGYTAILNNKDLGISRKIIFLRFSSEGIKEIDKFLLYSANNKNITEVIKTVGSSQLVVVTEGLEEIDIIREIRALFSIDDYMIFKSLKVHKKRYLPENFN